MSTFLATICDYSITNVGCQNAESLRLVSYITAICHCFAIAIILVHPICLVYRSLKLPNSGKLIKDDYLFTSSVLSALSHMCNLARYVILTIPTDPSDTYMILFYARTMIVLEYLTNLIGGIALSTLSAYFVQGAIGTNNQLFQVSGKKFDPQKIIKLFRLTILLYILTFFVLWLTKGMESQEEYVLYRRIIYYGYTVIVGVISPLIYHFFLSAIINKLTTYYKENEEPIPIALKYLVLLKTTLTRGFSFALATQMFLKVFGNDYLQNHLIAAQIITNVMTFYTATILSIYGIYKLFPRLANSISKSSHSKSSKAPESEDLSGAKSKMWFAKTEKTANTAATIVLPKTKTYIKFSVRD
ncbi:hypothetical protein HDV01_000934 [Terramyces sp. JEL0728]|nr:hypothetical protein HDV01_000934 [Terramyces sp. JEL0728]